MVRAHQRCSGKLANTDINVRALVDVDRRIPTDAIKLGDQSLAFAFILCVRNALPQKRDLFSAFAPALFLFDACRCHCVSSSNPTLDPE